MQRGFSAVLILILLVLLAVVLFIPFPSYQQAMGPCTMRYPEGDCIVTRQWILGPSLWNRLFVGQKPIPSPPTELSPLLDQTANWKTYTNGVGKFSIKYPSDWPYVKGKFYQGDATTINQIGMLDKIHFGTDNPDADIKPDEVIVFMAVYKNSPTYGKTPEEYFQKISDSVDSTTMKPIIVGEISGTRAFVRGMYPFSDTVVLAKDGFLYRIELLDTKAFNKDKEGNKRIFDQILSTFRFLE